MPKAKAQKLHTLTPKGEVTVRPDDGDLVTLYASFNRICDLKEAGVDVASGMDGADFSSVRTVVKVLGGFASDEEAGDAIDRVGFLEMSDAIGDALSASPSLRSAMADTDAEGDGDVDPKG